MKRRSISAVTFALLLASGCSQKTEDASGESAEVVDSYEAPTVNPTAAPGVAFKYRYDYELADGRISAVQEAHAARCEAMGVTRCRITGLNYSLGEDDRVSASLELKLAPDIARQFGKAATADVTKADGRLFRTHFEGEDTAPTTRAAEQGKADADARIAELEKQIADPRTRDRERAEMRTQLAELRDRTAASSATVAAQQERLASTPMTFTYYGRGGIPGFGHENPISAAFKLFVESAVTMISFLLRVVGVLLPWVLLGLLLLAITRTRTARRVWRWVRPADPDEQG